MLIDNKGKLFGKINIIDLIILLIIVGAVAGAVYKFSKANVGPMVKQDDVVIKFYTEEVPDFVASVVQKGDTVIDDGKNTLFGSVTDVSVNPSETVAMTSDGQFVKSEKPGTKSILITSEIKGVMGSNGATIGGVNYNIGQTLTIRAGKAKIWMRVYDVQKK